MAPQPDLTEFYKLSKPRKPPCQLRLILEGEITPKLSADEGDQLRAACEADRGIITSAAIQAWLAAKGHEINVNRISNHRRGVCDCE